MNTSHLLLGSLLLVGASVSIGRYAAVAQPGRDGGIAGTIGPDVIVGSLSGVGKYGTVGGISAYSLGTTSCNIGDEILLWCDTNVPGLCTNKDHPVIAQNLFRIKDGRIEQIGMSWLKHGFCALSGTLCSPCQSDPYGCDALGVGCSDPYSASLNGSQSNLGPRSQVNATTGVFPYPFSAPPAPATIGRRMQVPIDDLDPALNPGALYFGEGLYITADDAQAGNDNNNASYRRVTVGAFSSGSYTLSLTGSTIQQKAAIYAWQDNGLGVGIPDPDVVIVENDVPGDGMYILGYKASDNGDGTWRYEYAIYNMNADRSGRSFTVPVPAGVNVTNVGQHIVNHHSGEPYSTDAWTTSVDGSGVTWSTQTHAENPNANALRWGTMFNFRFDADTPPAETVATLGLFKPGEAADPTYDVLGPSAAATCPADLDGSGAVDGGDLGVLLSQFGTDGSADLDGSGTVDGGDLGILLAAWGDC